MNCIYYIKATINEVQIFAMIHKKKVWERIQKQVKF